MRLLNAEEFVAGTIHFESFQNDIPDYAIFSHTWNENHGDEIFYQEMLNFNNGLMVRPGYQKIANLCTQATHVGFRVSHSPSLLTISALRIDG